MKKAAKNQTTIEFLFKPKVTEPTVIIKKSKPSEFSEEFIVQEFYESLTEKEKTAHRIANEMLGTSYDVSRTHAFCRWKALLKK